MIVNNIFNFWLKKPTNLVITSGYFNPLGPHHIDYLRAAKNLNNKNNYHVCIVNSDEQVKKKGSIFFLDENSRLKIVQSLKCIDYALISIDIGTDVSFTIKKVWELFPQYRKHMYFVNGGPNNKNPVELNICKKLNIIPIYGVGGSQKTCSSSALIECAARQWVKKYLLEK